MRALLWPPIVAWAGSLLVVVAALEGGARTGRCATDPGASGAAALSLQSAQNASGHWLTRVRLEHAGGAAGGSGSSQPPVHLQLQRSVRPLTGGAHAIAVETTLTGSPSPGGVTPEGAACSALPAAPPACPPCACARRIPSGYQHFPGLGHYRLHLAPVTWFEAKATCEREGAHLAIMNSQAEAKMVANFFSLYPIPRAQYGVRIGMHDLLQEGNFITVHGQYLKETGFVVWKPGEPNNVAGNEHCGAVLPPGVLNDAPCEMKATFICELP